MRASSNYIADLAPAIALNLFARTNGLQHFEQPGQDGPNAQFAAFDRFDKGEFAIQNDIHTRRPDECASSSKIDRYSVVGAIK